MRDANHAKLDHVFDEMVVNGNMLHPGMEHRICAKVCCSNIITVYYWKSRYLDPKFLKKEHIHRTSDAAFAMALYSASVDERATPFCFFEDQETGVEPM